MALKTRKVEAGHYEYKHDTLGIFDIKCLRQGYWSIHGEDGFEKKYYRTKKACLNIIARHVEERTGTRPERKAPSSNRTFKAHHSNSKELRAQLPYPSNGCGPIAFARAMTRHDNPSDEEIGIMAAMISEELENVDSKGTHYGCLSKTATKLGIKHKVVEAEKSSNWMARIRKCRKYRVAKLPTVAQFLRANPTIKTAIFRTTGHAGYYDDGVAYNLGARARIDYALVLEWK